MIGMMKGGRKNSYYPFHCLYIDKLNLKTVKGGVAMKSSFVRRISLFALLFFFNG